MEVKTLKNYLNYVLFGIVKFRNMKFCKVVSFEMQMLCINSIFKNSKSNCVK